MTAPRHWIARGLAALLLASAPLLALAQPLLSPAELAVRLADPQLRIIDIRPREGAAGYDGGHLPGALSAPYERWRGPDENPGALPDSGQISALVRSLGIDATTPVAVVYEGGDATEFGAAARVYWTLKAVGLPQLSILNGGMKAWRGAGEPVTTQLRPVAPTTYAAQWDPRLIATQEEVAQAIGRQRLIDARPAPFFRGETKHPAARAPGTLVGAKNVEHDVWFIRGSATMQSSVELRRIAQQQGIGQAQPTVSFCNTGHWAATNWFVLSEVLGQPDVKLYPESMVGWSRAERPMDHVPSRLQQFWMQLKEAAVSM
ncbi:MAG TPA: rhodanese-like domain-containing protein [Burkholderiaceae bacterium]|nr:rhodanese-like domain-containing protein [Burkholderiaceae bacterium]